MTDNHGIVIKNNNKVCYNYNMTHEEKLVKIK